MKIENVDSVLIDQLRWIVIFTLTLKDGTQKKFVVSADRAQTYGDGIYFASFEDWKKNKGVD